jgi:hypothetical protein
MTHPYVDPEAGKTPDPAEMKRTAKRYAILLTCTHCVLFPLFLYGATGSLWVLVSDQYSPAMAWFLVIVTFLTPVSVPISIWLIWWSYLRGSYRGVIWFGLLPIITFESVFLVIVALKVMGII